MRSQNHAEEAQLQDTTDSQECFPDEEEVTDMTQQKQDDAWAEKAVADNYSFNIDHNHNIIANNLNSISTPDDIIGSSSSKRTRLNANDCSFSQYIGSDDSDDDAAFALKMHMEEESQYEAEEEHITMHYDACSTTPSISS